jgi:virulence-associated protein VapD
MRFYVIAEFQPIELEQIGFYIRRGSVYCAVRTGYLNEVCRISSLKKAVPWVKPLMTRLLQRRTEFHLRSIHFVFVVYKVVL